MKHREISRLTNDRNLLISPALNIHLLEPYSQMCLKGESVRKCYSHTNDLSVGYINNCHNSLSIKEILVSVFILTRHFILRLWERGLLTAIKFSTLNISTQIWPGIDYNKLDHIIDHIALHSRVLTLAAR